MKTEITTLDEAVALVETGSTIAFGGMTIYRRPMAFVRGLIQRKHQTGEPRNLTLLNFTAGMESDFLVGAGMIDRVRTCYFGLEIFGLAPMFTYRANRGEIEIIEESEASLALGLRAQMAGVGFMPSRAWLGTDLPRLRPDVKTVVDPYSGETLTAFPAIKPDIVVIHALAADPEGNVIIGDNQAIDSELALTGEKVIVTTETLVPELKKVDLVAPLIHTIVHIPQGAWPTSCHPHYALDGKAILEYVEQVSDQESFDRYIQTWIPVPSRHN
jgi:glutaconate CoA-transferase subunit A